MRRSASSIANRLPVGLRRALKRLPGTAALKDSLAGHPQLPPPAVGELRPVVYLPTWARWDEMRQRPQYLTNAFAEHGHAAYFVDPREPGVRAEGGVLIVPSLEQTPASGVIIYTHFAPLRTLIDRYDDAVVVYDILDDLSIYDEDEVGMPEERRVRHHHPAMMERADLVIASAPALVEKHGADGREVLYVENGVAPEAFGRPQPAPHELDQVKHPIVGYHGMIARWFDFGMVDRIADEHDDATVFLVGPVADEVRIDLDRIARRDNVVHVDAVPSDRVAAYVQQFDVGLVPFVVDDLTRAVSPLKMYEYMAAGVPVVASALPVCVAHPLVTTVASPEDAAAAVAQARATRSDPERSAILRRAADEASWGRRLAPVIERLDERGLRRVVG